MTASDDDVRRIRSRARRPGSVPIGPPTPAQLARFNEVNGAGVVRMGQGYRYIVTGDESEGAIADIQTDGLDPIFAAAIGTGVASEGFRVAGWGDHAWSYRAFEWIAPPNPPPGCAINGVACSMPKGDLAFHPGDLDALHGVYVSVLGTTYGFCVPDTDTTLHYYPATLSVGGVTFFGSWLSDEFTCPLYETPQRLIFVCYGGQVGLVSRLASSLCVTEDSWDFCSPTIGWYSPPFGMVFGSESTCWPFYLAIVDRFADGSEGPRRGTITELA